MALLKFVLFGLIGGIGIALILARKPWERPQLENLEDYVLFYSWWAGLINLVFLTCLALTMRWWTQPLPSRPLGKTSLSFPRGFSLCLGGAMVTCAIVEARTSNFAREAQQTRPALFETAIDPTAVR